MNITERLLYLVPDAKFLCKENDYRKITWYETNKKPLPSLEELEAVPQATLDAANPQIQKQKDLSDNLPSWDVVNTAIDNIANLSDARAFLKKLSKVVYWLAKGSNV